MTRSQTPTVQADSMICTVVDKIAEVEDVDPLKLTPPLFDVIDPDALDRIFATAPTDGRMEVEVTFSYNGYEVTVRGDGHVSVEA